MALLARRDDGELAVIAAGAYQHGGRLRCPLLLVMAMWPDRDVTLRDPTTTADIRVRLPDQAVNADGHVRFDREELEIL